MKVKKELTKADLIKILVNEVYKKRLKERSICK
jgi:hypothetical protein